MYDLDQVRASMLAADAEFDPGDDKLLQIQKRAAPLEVEFAVWRAGEANLQSSQCAFMIAFGSVVGSCLVNHFRDMPLRQKIHHLAHFTDTLNDMLAGDPEHVMTGKAARFEEIKPN
jgi:hypothetical protein